LIRVGVLLMAVTILLLTLGVGTASAQSTEFRVTGDLYLGPGETVDNLVTLNGDLTIEGHVLENAFTANGDIHVLSSGRVDGNAVSVTGKVIVDEGGLVSGDQVQVGDGAGRVRDARPVVVDRNTGFGGAGWFFWLLSGLGLGLLLVLLAGGSLKSVGHELSMRPARSALIGLLSPFVLLVLFIILLISVIGIPVALLMIPLVPLVGMFGLFAIAMLAGQRLLEMVGRSGLGDVWAMLAGVVLLNLISLIPVVGALAWVVGGFVGFGATVSRIWDHYLGRRAVRATDRAAGVSAAPAVGPAGAPPMPPTAPMPPSAPSPVPPAPPAPAEPTQSADVAAHAPLVPQVSSRPVYTKAAAPTTPHTAPEVPPGHPEPETPPAPATDQESQGDLGPRFHI
jgi:hypothetical protein